MILQPIKLASLLFMATVGLMGCLYLTPKKHLSLLTSWRYYLGCTDGKLYATCSKIFSLYLLGSKKNGPTLPWLDVRLDGQQFLVNACESDIIEK